MRRITRRARFAALVGECFDGLVVALVLLGVAILLHDWSAAYAR